MDQNLEFNLDPMGLWRKTISWTGETFCSGTIECGYLHSASPYFRKAMCLQFYHQDWKIVLSVRAEQPDAPYFVHLWNKYATAINQRTDQRDLQAMVREDFMRLLMELTGSGDNPTLETLIEHMLDVGRYEGSLAQSEHVKGLFTALLDGAPLSLDKLLNPTK